MKIMLQQQNKKKERKWERGKCSQHKFAISTPRIEKAFETLRILAAHKQTGAASSKEKTFAQST